MVISNSDTFMKIEKKGHKRFIKLWVIPTFVWVNDKFS